jgi:hypothetical protein
MKTRLIIMTALVCLMALPLAGCSGFHFVVGTGNVVTKAFDFKDFKNLEISNAIQYNISQASDFSVSVSAHENIIPYLDVYQSGTTLVVRMKSGSFSNTDANATITLPELERLSVSGASKGSATGFKSSSDLNVVVSGASQLDLSAEANASEINVSGAGRITGHIVAQDARFNISGASRCELEGATGTSYLEVSGASRFNSPNLILKNANAHVSGASHATLNTSGILNLEVTGASTLDYYGNPTLNKVNVNGASQLNKK